jgi:membrane fusion protein (multidrug efflux system)
MRNKRTVVIAALVLCATAIAVLWRAAGGQASAVSPEQGQQKKPPLVEVAPVRQASITRTLELTGEVVATDAVVIAATKDGPIAYCPWREGDEVHAGERLVEINREVHRAEVKAAQATLAVAKARLDDLTAGARPEEIQKAEADVRRRQASLEEARKGYERQAELIRQDFTSQQSVDQACERMEVAEAELAAAQETLRMLKAGPTATELAVQAAAVQEAAARLELAQAHLAECVITAPFDGTITKVHVRPGDLASAKSPLVEMFAPSSLVVRFAVPEAEAAAVRQDMGITVTLDAFRGKAYEGKIARVYPELDRRMRTRTVEVELTDQAALVPGMFARAQLALQTVNDAVVVPADAVIATPKGGRVAYVIEDGKAVQRKVVTGIEEGAKVQIVSGLKPGETLVVAGNEKLKDGVAVRVPEAGKAGGKPEGRNSQAARTGTQPSANVAGGVK